jgi:hypothetical protein
MLKILHVLIELGFGVDLLDPKSLRKKMFMLCTKDLF